MLWLTLLLALIISFAALGYVLWPFLSKDVPHLPVDNDRLTDLLARKDRALRSLKDLEFDHQVGKISDEDFQRFNYRWSRQAIALIQQVEKITPATSELDDLLEAEIAQLRRVQATTRVGERMSEDPAAPTIPAATPHRVKRSSYRTVSHGGNRCGLAERRRNGHRRGACGGDYDQRDRGANTRCCAGFHHRPHRSPYDQGPILYGVWHEACAVL